MTDPVESRPARSRTRPSWIILGVFVVLTLILTWPVASSLSSRIPGTATWAFDESTFAWNIWYFKHALLDLRTSPLHTELIWYPLGIDLILYTFNFFNAIIALPLLLATNVPLASNIAVLLTTILSGFGAYLLTLYVIHCTLQGAGCKFQVPGSTYHASRIAPAQSSTFNVQPSTLRAAALLAGLIYAFASNRAIYAALGHYNFATTQWLPFYALYLLKTLHEPKLKNAVLAGFFFALAALTDMTFAALLAMFTLIVLLVSWRELTARWAAIKRLLLAGFVAALIWAPVLIPIAREFVTGNYGTSGWGESVKLSADAVGLVTPTDLNPLTNDRGAGSDAWPAALRAVEEGKSRFGDINTVFLGFATLALAVLGAILARRRLAAWIWTALVFGVLALGPLLQIAGRYRFSFDNLLPEGVTLPLPAILLHFVPFLNANRAPNRHSTILMLALAVLAGYGVAWLLGRVSRLGNKEARKQGPGATSLSTRLPVYLSICLLAALVILEHLAVPLPTTDATIPEVYRRIGAESDAFAVMQLPLGWRDSYGVLGSEQTNLQYFQTGHGKPLIGGNISRAPADKMGYFARIPLFKALTDLELYRDIDPQTDAAARTGAGPLMALYDVRYFITTPPIPGRFPYQDTWKRTEDYALDVLPLEKPATWEQDGYRAYRVIQPPIPFPFRVDVGTPGAEPYLDGGWDVRTDEQPYNATANWATARTTELYLPLDAAKDATLRLALAPLSYPGAPAQKLSIAVNDVPVLRDHALTTGWQTIETRVPAAATQRGPNRVRLEFAQIASPRTVFPDAASRAVIGGTGGVSPVNIDAHGFTEAYISAFGPDGQEVKASSNRRGYNVAVFDPHTGQLLEMRGFDTAANSYEADALAAYLSSVPHGRIVTLATKGDAAAHLTPAAITALRGLGSRAASPADLAGQSHALVGVQGAAPGTAAEEIKPGDAFVRVAGDFRTLAAALDWVEWGP